MSAIADSKLSVTTRNYYIMDKIKASAHNAFMKLGGIQEQNFKEAKKVAVTYFVREYGRELSMKEDDDLDKELDRLIVKKSS